MGLGCGIEDHLHRNVQNEGAACGVYKDPTEVYTEVSKRRGDLWRIKTQRRSTPRRSKRSGDLWNIKTQQKSTPTWSKADAPPEECKTRRNSTPKRSKRTGDLRFSTRQHWDGIRRHITMWPWAALTKSSILRALAGRIHGIGPRRCERTPSMIEMVGIPFEASVGRQWISAGDIRYRGSDGSWAQFICSQVFSMDYRLIELIFTVS